MSLLHVTRNIFLRQFFYFRSWQDVPAVQSLGIEQCNTNTDGWPFLLMIKSWIAMIWFMCIKRCNSYYKKSIQITVQIKKAK